MVSCAGSLGMLGETDPARDGRRILRPVPIDPGLSSAMMDAGTPVILLILAGVSFLRTV